MKKVILSLFAWMLTASMVSDICYAATIDVNSAKTVASNFYSSNSDKKITSISVAFTETASDGSPAYYVFNINSNDGFVIITADDASLPIIGYATTGHYDAGKVIPPVVAWLGKRKQEISYIKSHNLPATEKIKAQWQALQTVRNRSNARMTGTVSPLCTTTWNQETYYNALCPSVEGFSAVTGCVATAMAQVMKYWNYPVHGIGSVSYADSISHGFQHNIGVLSADFGNTTYDWSAMTNNVTTGNAAVATLMYHCGVSVYMDYGNGFTDAGSDANVVPFDSSAWMTHYGGMVCSQTAYSRYFGYDSAAMQGLQKFEYTDSAWILLLENELNESRPIQYAGYTDTTRLEGHSWVCDGYDANNTFHMNWGWSGDFDGYFSVEDLSAGGYHLNTYEEVLIGIEPPVATGIKENQEDAAVSIYPNPCNGKITVYGLRFAVSEIEVYNLLGAKVFVLTNQQINNSTIDLSAQPSGVYIIRIQDGDGVVNKKLVIE